MAKTIVDARGELCPKPLIMTKRAIKEGAGSFEVLIDNKTSCENVSRFLADNHISYTEGPGEREGEYRIRVAPEGTELEKPDAAAYCAVPTTKSESAGYVIAFTRATMGEGPEELGRILIQGFCNTIKEMDPLPAALIFYNSGIALARKDSPVIEALIELENQGVDILVCGTCTDYFSAKNQIGVGTISNMYTIMERLTLAGHVITP